MAQPPRRPDSGGDDERSTPLSDSGSSNGVDLSKAGFFTALFDMGFRHLVTLRAVQVLYAVALIGIALGVIAGMISAVITLTSNPMTGAVLLVVVPILGFVLLLGARVLLELVVTVFRIGDNLQALRDRIPR